MDLKVNQNIENFSNTVKSDMNPFKEFDKNFQNGRNGGPQGPIKITEGRSADKHLRPIDPESTKNHQTQKSQKQTAEFNITQKSAKSSLKGPKSINTEEGIRRINPRDTFNQKQAKIRKIGVIPASGRQTQYSGQQTGSIPRFTTNMNQTSNKTEYSYATQFSKKRAASNASSANQSKLSSAYSSESRGGKGGRKLPKYMVDSDEERENKKRILSMITEEELVQVNPDKSLKTRKGKGRGGGRGNQVKVNPHVDLKSLFT